MLYSSSKNVGFDEIFCLIRTKVDMNRDIIEGAQGNPVAMAAYKCYHDYIKRAQSFYNRGILFDLHGQVYILITNMISYLCTYNVTTITM